MALNPRLWDGKRVLVTGHTGFKGSWLSLLLKDLGASVIGISLPPHSQASLYLEAGIGDELNSEFFQDIRDEKQVERIISESGIDYVFHLAAQAFVRRSLRNPLESITTNVSGTANILKSSLTSKVVSGLTIVTTDKVYENLGSNLPFKESDKLGGQDPYSASKAAAEIIVASMSASNNPMRKPVTTVRAGNVIGGGDWGEERLIPDLIRSINSNSNLLIRNPNSTRPWQHVLDCLHGYLQVAESHLEHKANIPSSVNFGPDESLSVTELISLFEEAFEIKIPYKIVESLMPESTSLKLDSSVAKEYFGWRTTLSSVQAVKQTANWYSKFRRGVDANELMHSELSAYKVGKW